MTKLTVLSQVIFNMLVAMLPALVLLSVLSFVPVNTTKGKRSLLVVLAKKITNTLK